MTCTLPSSKHSVYLFCPGIWAIKPMGKRGSIEAGVPWSRCSRPLDRLGPILRLPRQLSPRSGVNPARESCLSVSIVHAGTPCLCPGTARLHKRLSIRGDNCPSTQRPSSAFLPEKEHRCTPLFWSACGWPCCWLPSPWCIRYGCGGRFKGPPCRPDAGGPGPSAGGAKCLRVGCLAERTSA
jgi:hypothetical protein